MKILNKNIDINRRFNIFELPSLFCILLIGFFVFSQKHNSSYGIQKAETYSIVSNQHNADFAFLSPASPATSDYLPNYLFFSSLEEESKFEDSEEETLAIGHSLQLATFFNYNVLLVSFSRFSEFLQKRTIVPYFILHHSLKIPSL